MRMDLLIVPVILMVLGTPLKAEEHTGENEPQLPVYPPVETYSAISERPLFNARRRPKPKEEVAETSNAAELKEAWHLVGTIVQDEKPIALFSQIKGSKRINLTVGSLLDKQWELQEIGDDYAVLVADEEEARFELWKPRALESAKPKARAPQENGQPNQRAQTNPKNPSEKTRQGGEIRPAPVRTN